MLTITRSLAIAGLITLVSAGNALAERIQPFILGSSSAGDFASTVSDTKSKLSGAGFDVVGTHAPYAGAEIIVFTSDEMKAAATKSERGGYGAAMRVSVTDNGGNIHTLTQSACVSARYILAFHNPLYNTFDTPLPLGPRRRENGTENPWILRPVKAGKNRLAGAVL